MTTVSQDRCEYNEVSYKSGVMSKYIHEAKGYIKMIKNLIFW